MQLDTFDSPTEEMNSDGLDTFDNAVYPSDDPGNNIQDETPVESKDANEEGGDTGEQVDPNSQVSNLEEVEEKGSPKSKDKDPEDEDNSDEDGDKEDGEENEQSDKAKSDSEKLPEKQDSEEKVKTIKAFRGDKAYEIPKDAELLVKVAGKSRKVSLDELKSAYSGEINYTEKLEKFDVRVKDFDKKESEFNSKSQELATEMRAIKELADKGMKNEIHPLKFVEKMLDIFQIDAYDYTWNMREFMQQEFELLQELGPEGIESYKQQERTKYLLDKQKSETERLMARQTAMESQNEVAKMREAYGISEDQYNSAYEELSRAGYEGLQPRNVLDFAVNKPLVEKALDLITPYQEQIETDEFDSLTRDIAESIKKGHSEEDIKKQLEEVYAVNEIVDALSEKKSKSSTKKPSKKEKAAPKQHELESFDDYDMELYGYN